MKLRTALTLAALAGIMSLPLAANAQNRGGQDLGRGAQQRQDARGTSNGRSTSGRSQDQGKSEQKKADNRGGSNDRGNSWENQVRGRGQQPQDWRGWPDNRGNQDNRNKDQGKGNDRGSSQWDRNQNDRGTRGSGGWSMPGRDGDRTDYHFNRSDHNDWRDILYTDGFFADVDLFLGDSEICFGGSAGAYLPIWQFQQDCVSRDDTLRARADLFEHPFYFRNGVRYERRDVMHNGVECYQFVRC